jgi:hypothetical protein
VPNAPQCNPNEVPISFSLSRTADSAYYTARPSGGGFGIRIANATVLFVFCIGFFACTKQVVAQDLDAVPSVYRPLFGPPGISEQDAKALRADLPFDSISLERTPCGGRCPVYKMVLHRDGKAELDATAHLPKLGKFIGEVDIFTYGRLCYLVENSHFDKLDPDYRDIRTEIRTKSFNGSRESIRVSTLSWTDAPFCVVAVTSGTTSKKVSSYSELGPIELWAIQEVLDSTKDKIEWKTRQ